MAKELKDKNEKLKAEKEAKKIQEDEKALKAKREAGILEAK